MVMMLRARAMSASWRTGKSCPDWLVMWQKCITLVCGVIARVSRPIRSSPLVGAGKSTLVSLILSRRTRWSQVVSIRP